MYSVARLTKLLEEHRVTSARAGTLTLPDDGVLAQAADTDDACDVDWENTMQLDIGDASD
jgi:hypothetical protein